MIRTFVIALSLVLAGCVAERLPPGPGPATPVFVDEGHWRAQDGYVLGMSQWQAPNPRAVIVALHGMNDYGQFIEPAAKHWQTRRIATYAYDQRGFGRTEGNGRWPGHEVMAEDARTFVQLVRARHPGVPVYLLGESMGGAVAMVAAAGRAEPIADGLILVSPALWGWSNLDIIKRSALWVMMQIAPGSRLSGRGLNIKPSDNEQMLIALGRDPYVIKATRVDAVHGLTDLMEAAWQAAPAVRVPTMVLYADGDEVVPSKPTTDAAAAMPGTKHIVCYDDGFHMLLRDTKGERTWAAIEAFIGGDGASSACAEQR
ncbi:MAG: alpha/beta hydrolase [Alphaproteobacteria bacterium]|nr:alpha/beta hydrolase [Alphaproteobacteria bacterium]